MKLTNKFKIIKPFGTNIPERRRFLLPIPESPIILGARPPPSTERCPPKLYAKAGF